MQTPITESEPTPPKDEQDETHSESNWGWVIVAAVAILVIIGRFTPFGPVQSFFDGWRWVTEQMLELARELFERYGYLTTFLAPLLENTILLGALIPGVLVMLLAGLSAHDGLVSIWLALPLGIAGAIIGDTISYGIGRFGGQRMGPESNLIRMADRMRDPLMRNSTLLILTYHFFGYSRLIGPAAAGFLHVPFRRWAVLDYIGVSVWVAVFMIAGYLLGVFGLSLDDTEANIRVFEIVLFGLFALWVFALIGRNMRRGSSKTPPAGG
jgi:membrane protein DedA with SNARE-associated domain